ncbi:LysR family transcriptional regulator [Nannocystis bainbridge]|uniref:LysR family transcriptional regulator n=1 Tax=Nannocystis bainbridge TaxID=2995303 RepID=A0ABT5E5Z4_9BACT|nr:LysR family transcriptional regulator [Nannocystis bainbridge]MDC0721283.1 LysR family transcriptional regulator [Nannocystis bainbridge]
MEIDSTTWDDLRVLLAVHRHGSFLAAGRALGTSTSTVARRIEALEAALGGTLVHRSSAGTSIEPDALQLVALAEELEHGLQAVRRDAGGRSSKLAGTVRLSVGDGFVRAVTQGLCEFRRKHPETCIELMAESRLADLARREADIGLRTTRTESQVLIERRLGVLHLGLFASQAYVERRLRGARLRPGDYERHDFIGHSQAMPRQRELEEWLVARGAKHFPFRSNSMQAIHEATERGQGIAMMAEVVGRELDNVVRIEIEEPLPSVTVWLVYHRELRQVPRIRAVVAALEELFHQRVGAG